MKKPIIALALLIAGTVPAFAYQFYLSSNRVFTSEEEVQVQLYNYNYQNYNGNGSLEDISFILYRATDPKAFFSATNMNYNQFGIRDEVIREMKIEKAWEEEKAASGRNNTLNLGKLSPGAYLLEAIANGEVAQVPVIVSEYNIITKTIGQEMLAFITDAKTGRAITGFEAFSIVNNKKLKATTYRNGIAYFSLENLSDRANHYSGYQPIFAFKGEKVAVSQSYFYYYYNYYGRKNRLISYLYTDRSAYRPKQTVNFKGIFRERKGFLFNIPRDSFTYTIRSPREEVLKGRAALDEYGTFNGQFHIEENHPLGTYTLYVTFDDNPYRNYASQYYADGSYTFEVQEYKKPEYKVNVVLDKNQYVLGDEMQVKVNGSYFFGAPVINGEVNYSVVREEYYIPWWYNHPYYWWYSDYYSSYYSGNRETVKYGEGKLDEEGNFTVNIQTDTKKSQNYKYTIVASVRDASRRNISGSKTVIVAHSEFTLSGHAEKYYYTTDEEFTALAVAKDFSNQPVATEITASLIYYQDYWKHYHKNRNGSTLEVKAFSTNPQTGEADIRFKTKEPGYYELKLTAKDARGKTVETSFTAYVMRPGDYNYNWWQNNSGQITFMTDKKVYKAGETVNAMIYLPEAADAMLTVNNASLAYFNSFRFESQGEEGAVKQLSFTLPQNSYGKIELELSYAKESRFHRKAEQITVIPQNQYLDVSIEFDREDYRPGNTAYAKVIVRDNTGKPVTGAAITLSTIDESIFSMYPDNSQDIRQAFYTSQYYGTNYVYRNQFNSYNYSQQLQNTAISWRKEKLSLSFDKSAYLSGDNWYRIQYSPIANPDYKSWKISGYILSHESGKPLSGAKVHIGEKTTITDSRGFYSLSGFPESPVKVVITHQGHRTELSHIALKQLYHLNLNVAVSAKKDMQQAPYPHPGTIDLTATPDSASLQQIQVISGGIPAGYGEITGGTVSMDAYDDITVVEEANEELAVKAAPVADERRESLSGRGIFERKAKCPKFGDMNGKDKIDGTRPTQGQSYKEATIRKAFKDAIYWNPTVITNGFGEAVVKITLPDNLTTWRTTAKVITKDTKVGQTNVKTIVTKNLLVRMETPRFMRAGDQLLIATNIHNYLSKTKKVKVQLEAEGLALDGTARYVDVSANGEARVDWEIDAALVQEATLTVKALTDEESDAKQVKVPILPYGLEMITAQSSYLAASGEKQMKIFLPKHSNLNAASLQLSIAPSVSAALLNSMDQLIGYPYGCVEQTMSRFMPNVVVANTLKSLGGLYSAGIDQAELEKMVAHGAKRLKELQHKDGGWGWWVNDASHPYYTAYVSNGLYLAQKAGYDIDPEMYQSALTALRAQISSGSKAPKGQSHPETHALQVMVAMQCGMKELWKQIKPSETGSPYETALWLQAAVLAGDRETAARMKTSLENSVTRAGNQVYWGGKKFYYSWQEDRVETTANVVKAIAMIDPEHDLIPFAVQYLMEARKGSAWHNTRQTAVCILGLNEVIKRELNPNFDLEVYANGSLIFREHFDKTNVKTGGKNIELKGEKLTASASKSSFLPGFNILKHGENTLRIVQRGQGAAYVNTKLTYFLEGKDQLPADQKESQFFSLNRQYFKLERKIDPKTGIVTYGKAPLDKENIRSGDQVLVKVKVKAPSNQQNVLIEDAIPAGFEFIRDAKPYQIQGEPEYDGKKDYWNSRYYSYYNWNRWYTHREYRDSKLAMTITHLGAGEYTYSYLMQAEIPGTFKVTPAIAQLMYYPENRGFSEFETLIVRDSE